MKSTFAAAVLAVLCFLSFSLMLYAARDDAAITDESAHIPAGYGYASQLDYRLNPEHPPLLKSLSGAALLLIQPVFRTDEDAWQNGINAQWELGSKFLYQGGNNADEILRFARFPAMLLTLATVLLLYFFARSLLGSLWALLPAFLFGLSPTILAHGHYVTTDVSAAFGILLGTAAFLKYLKSPSTKTVILAGLALGVAQLCKFSVFLLVPFFILMLALRLVVRELRERHAGTFRWGKFFREATKRYGQLLLVFVIGYLLVVYPVYFLFTRHYPAEKQLSDAQFILASYGGGPTPAGQLCRLARCPADVGLFLIRHEATRPLGQYALGLLMTFQRSVGGNTNYFFGSVSAAGSRWYFPAVFAMKETLPALILVLIAAWYGITRFRKFFRENAGHRLPLIISSVQWEFSYVTLGAFVALYWGSSIASPLNIGFRHLIPTLPFIYILATAAWKGWLFSPGGGQTQTAGQLLASYFRALSAAAFKALLLFLLLVWAFIEALAAAPYFLSYFNEAVGGVMGGYRYVTDSNYDWGQDLVRLRDWLGQHPEVDKIAVDYFGGGNPRYYLGDKEFDWQSSRGNPATQGIHYLAVSVNSLQGAIQPTADNFQRKTEDEYRWLTASRPKPAGLGEVPAPDWRVGTSIFVYKL